MVSHVAFLIWHNRTILQRIPHYLKIEDHLYGIKRNMKILSISMLSALVVCGFCIMEQSHAFACSTNNKASTLPTTVMGGRRDHQMLMRQRVLVGTRPTTTRRNRKAQLTTTLSMSSENDSSNSNSNSRSNSKEEEIAKLEEQLKQLRQEAEQESGTAVVASSSQKQQQQKATVETVASSSSIGDTDFVGRGPAKRPVQPQQEMLSEAWKETTTTADEKNDSGIGGTIPSVVAGIAFLVLIGFFAQVPVGQEDLGKYQAVKTNTQIDLGDINPSRSSSE